MADAYCGPSNPLQNLQKHSSVDRTLQQDRLAARHGPSSQQVLFPPTVSVLDTDPIQQGFRSSSGPGTGLLDAEFDAFQAGLHVPAPFSPPHQHLPFHPLHQHAGPPAPSQGQLPDWAADFQRLHVSSHTPPVQLNAPPPQSVGSWHMDFMKQQQAPTPSAGAQIPLQHHNTQPQFLGRPQGFPMSGGSPFNSALMDTRNYTDLKSGASMLNEAESMNQTAFESMFDQVAAEHEAQETERGKGKEPEVLTIGESQQSQGNTIRWTEGPQSQEKVDERYQTPHDFEYKRDLDAAIRYATSTPGVIQPMLEAANKQRLSVAEGDAKTREAARLMREMGLDFEDLNPLINFEYTRDLDSEMDQATSSANNSVDTGRDIESNVHHHQNGEAVAEPSPGQEHHQPPHNDEELAQAAGQLLASISDDTSQKFQESNFLALMRKLRDYEVRVEGDQMIETNAPPTQETAPAASAIPLDQQDTDDARYQDPAAGAR